MHESGRDSAQISRETQKSGLRAICRDCAGRRSKAALNLLKRTGRLMDTAFPQMPGWLPPRRREVAPSGDERGVGGIYERFQTNKN